MRFGENLSVPGKLYGIYSVGDRRIRLPALKSIAKISKGLPSKLNIIFQKNIENLSTEQKTEFSDSLKKFSGSENSPGRQRRWPFQLEKDYGNFGFFEEMFENLQEVFSKLHTVEGRQFILDIDAFDHGIGGVLSQIQDGKELVIAYFSRVLNKAKKNYCMGRITGRELFTAVDSMKELDGQLARWFERGEKSHGNTDGLFR
ncbi:hypothetical protein HZH68_016347 [Vespula germanica]|uniref:Reverse transcriptase/retrotransposon-derived protein RNase H-like domain-containing protein n=1 Tax=Vespula germanica TaxID=30212 RepID=A0A834J2M6_VESGE|nr:hypothetical protein HZH68_016347 [Vespula germanica]